MEVTPVNIQSAHGSYKGYCEIADMTEELGGNNNGLIDSQEEIDAAVGMCEEAAGNCQGLRTFLKLDSEAQQSQLGLKEKGEQIKLLNAALQDSTSEADRGIREMKRRLDDYKKLEEETGKEWAAISEKAREYREQCMEALRRGDELRRGLEEDKREFDRELEKSLEEHRKLVEKLGGKFKRR